MKIETEPKIEVPGYNLDVLLTVCGQVGKTSSFWDIQDIHLQDEEAPVVSEILSSSRIPSSIQLHITLKSQKYILSHNKLRDSQVTQTYYIHIRHIP